MMPNPPGPQPVPAPAVDPPARDVPVLIEKERPPITVADALAASRQAHAAYQQHSPRMAAVPGSTPVVSHGDARAALAALKRAASQRAYAEGIDPMHHDPAWAEDGRTHPAQETLVFYLQQLAK